MTGRCLGEDCCGDRDGFDFLYMAERDALALPDNRLMQISVSFIQEVRTHGIGIHFRPPGLHFRQEALR